MQEPLPTPYDISPLPQFAFEPSTELWIICLSVSILVVFILAVCNWMFSRRRSPEKAVNKALERISRIQSNLTQENSKNCAEELSLVLRRFLSTYFAQDLVSLSNSELTAWAKSSSNLKLAEFSNILQLLDEIKYSSSNPPSTSLQHIVADLPEQVKVLTLAK